ncbi:MAG: hypothetical protein MUP81_03655 [Dehalococcoidia bacterium]|nr:hypothetical protein [Dehalococcoidia bacterium]
MKTKETPKATKAEIDAKKKAAFVRVVKPRVNKALKAITLIGNCAGSGYIFTQPQKDDIFKALHSAITDLEGKFSGMKKSQSVFEFKAGS